MFSLLHTIAVNWAEVAAAYCKSGSGTSVVKLSIGTRWKKSQGLYRDGIFMPDHFQEAGGHLLFSELKQCDFLFR